MLEVPIDCSPEAGTDYFHMLTFLIAAHLSVISLVNGQFDDICIIES